MFGRCIADTSILSDLECLSRRFNARQRWLVDAAKEAKFSQRRPLSVFALLLDEVCREALAELDIVEKVRASDWTRSSILLMVERQG